MQNYISLINDIGIWYICLPTIFKNNEKNNLILQRWSKCKAVFLEVKDKNSIKRGLLLKENPCTFKYFFYFFLDLEKMSVLKQETPHPEAGSVLKPEDRRH